MDEKTMSEPGGGYFYQCHRCDGVNCGPSGCQFDCEVISPGTSCQTYVKGGGGAGAYSVETHKAQGETYDYARFLCQRVIRCNKAMLAAGVPIGATVTHVDDVFFNDADSFADAVLDLRGKKLRLIFGGSAVEVTLK